MAANGIRFRKGDGRLSGAVKRDATRAVPQKNGARAASNAMSERRARILEVAMRRFAESGFEATTIRQIADDVNILSGSLYHHFATKDEMLHEIVRDAVKQMRDNTIRIAQSPVNAEHRLVGLILLDLGELTRNQKVHAILTNDRRLFRQGKEFAYIVEAKKEAYHAWRTVVQDGIDSKLFRPGIDLFLTILTIMRMLNTAADWYTNEDAYVSGRVGTYTLDKVIDFHLEFILSAIRVPARVSEPIPRQSCEELARFRT
jgi:AcrR family transcriptional regulator